MARNHLTAVAPSLAGTVCTLAAATDTQGDAVRPTWALWVRNGGGTARTVTVVTGGVEDPNLAIADLTITVDANTERLIGPFPDYFPQTSNDVEFGWVHVNYDAITSVSRIAVAL